MALPTIDLYELIDPGNTEQVCREMLHISHLLFPAHDTTFVSEALADTVRLFQGDYPGFRECTTLYHDLEHTLSVLLAAIRMFHGAVLDGTALDAPDMDILIACALFHDVGFIQEVHDTEGTGAKYIIGHEERSIRFLSAYLGKRGFAPSTLHDCAQIISCTDMRLSLHDMDFRSEQAATLGRMLGAADLLAQMADRAYLEKLLLLYKEFREAGVPGFDTEIKLLENTNIFYNTVQNRLLRDYAGVSAWLKHHFDARWSLPADLYHEAMERNITYLGDILSESKASFCSRLRRSGIVKKLNGDCDASRRS